MTARGWAVAEPLSEKGHKKMTGEKSTLTLTRVSINHCKVYRSKQKQHRITLEEAVLKLLNTKGVKQ